MDKITVGLITYNRVALVIPDIGNTIKNCSDQHSLEIIVVNNASTDNTLAELQRIQNEFRGHPRIVDFIIVDLPENKGVASRNRYFERATGKYLLQTDDDAFGLPGWDQLAISYMLSDTFAVGQQGRYVDPNWLGFSYGAPLIGDYVDHLTGFGTFFGNIDFSLLMIPEDWPFWAEEVWWCLNVKRLTGLRVRLTPPLVCHLAQPKIVDWELHNRMIQRAVDYFRPLENELHLEEKRV